MRPFSMAAELFLRSSAAKPKVRAIIDAFIDRVFEDRMIGFFFRNADRGRIKDMEYQFAAQFSRRPIEYQRPAAGPSACQSSDHGRPFRAPSPDF